MKKKILSSCYTFSAMENLSDENELKLMRREGIMLERRRQKRKKKKVGIK